MDNWIAKIEVDENSCQTECIYKKKRLTNSTEINYTQCLFPNELCFGNFPALRITTAANYLIKFIFMECSVFILFYYWVIFGFIRSANHYQVMQNVIKEARADRVASTLKSLIVPKKWTGGISAANI